MAIVPDTSIEYEVKRHDEITSAYSYAPYVTAWKQYEYGVAQNPVCRWNYPTQTIHTEAGDSSVYADILWLYDPEYVFPEANILINADSTDTLNVITKLDIQQYKFKIKGFRTMYASDTGVSNTINSRTAGYTLQTNENIVDIQYCFYDIDDPETEIYNIYPIIRYIVNGETWYFRINILFSNYIRNVPTDSNKLTVQAPDGYFSPHDESILLFHSPVSSDWTKNFPSLNNAFLCGTNSDYNVVFSNVSNGNNSLYSLAASVETMLHIVATLGIYFDYNGTMYLGFMDSTGQTTGEYLTEEDWSKSAQYQSDNINNYTEHTPPYVPPDPDGDDLDDIDLSDALYGAGMAHYYICTKASGVLNTISEAMGNLRFSEAGTNLFPNLISCKLFPSGTGAVPAVNSTFKIAGKELLDPDDEQPISIQEVTGSPSIIIDDIAIDRKFGDFRDYAPYTMIELYVPFCGWTALPSWSMGGTVSGKIIIDIIDGSCKAVIEVTKDGKKTPVAELSGCCSLDIPFTAENVGAKMAGIMSAMSASATAALESAVGVGTMTVTGGKSGGKSVISGLTSYAASLCQATLVNNQNYTQVTGRTGDGCNLGGVTDIVLKIQRPNTTEYSAPLYVPDGFAHAIGFMSMKQKKVSECTGLIICDNVDTSGIGGATDDERAEIKRVLETGLYVNAAPE